MSFPPNRGFWLLEESQTIFSHLKVVSKPLEHLYNVEISLRFSRKIKIIMLPGKISRKCLCSVVAVGIG